VRGALSDERPYRERSEGEPNPFLELIPVAWTHNLSVVMPGLVPGTHAFRATKQGVDGRDTPGTKCPGAGHDELGDST
jgi:hypothetical protein